MNGDSDLTRLVIQAALGGGGLGLGAVLFGIWDRRLKARADARTEDRTDDQDWIEEQRKDRIELRAERDDAKREAAAERDAHRATRVEFDRAWTKLHAMDRFVHWWWHKAGSLIMGAYKAGQIGEPMPKGLPDIPPVDQIEHWQPPAPPK